MDRSPLPRALAAGRLVGVAGAVLGLGSGAHLLAGGTLPAPGALLLLAVPVLLAAALLARRPLSVRVLLPVALAGQLGVHAGLTWLTAGAGVPAVAAGHAHGAVPSGAPPAGLAVPAGLPAPAGLPGLPGLPVLPGLPAAGLAGAEAHAHAASPLMLAAHAAALVVAVLLLVGTERGIASTVRRWSAVLPALLGAAGRPRSRARGPVAVAVRAVRPLPAGRGGVGRRGPPAVAPLATAA